VWRGRAREELVIYEMHVGTFTPDGSWQAAEREVPSLAELGITCIEIMPVAEFPGQFGWGYDGVNLFAPTRLYGRPVDFRAIVDRAHALGIAVHPTVAPT
jgi:maltooligosyltrehalose trehalohydrolase